MTTDAGRSTRSVDHVGVVVPAKDEQDTLAACLAALARAAARVAPHVRIVVVLDDCTDASHAVSMAAAHALRLTGERTVSIDVLSVRSNNVGTARAAGVDAVLAAHRGRGEVWLAGTDADSVVPPDWLTHQLDHAAAGADVVAGTIVVRDWSDRSKVIARTAEQHYIGTRGRGRADHGHVHGANLGLTGTAYRMVGGFPRVATHEDVGLVQACVAAGMSIAWTSGIPVCTSARRVARAPGGFAGYLDDLERAQARAPAVLDARSF